jgi:hypothetical protein
MNNPCFERRGTKGKTMKSYYNIVRAAIETVRRRTGIPSALISYREDPEGYEEEIAELTKKDSKYLEAIEELLSIAKARDVENRTPHKKGCGSVYKLALALDKVWYIAYCESRGGDFDKKSRYLHVTDCLVDLARRREQEPCPCHQFAKARDASLSGIQWARLEGMTLKEAMEHVKKQHRETWNVSYVLADTIDGVAEVLRYVVKEINWIDLVCPGGILPDWHRARRNCLVKVRDKLLAIGFGDLLQKEIKVPPPGQEW